MNNFEHRVLRIKPINLCQFRTQGLESTAEQRCARKSTEFASGQKNVGENRGETGISLI